MRFKTKIAIVVFSTVIAFYAMLAASCRSRARSSRAGANTASFKYSTKCSATYPRLRRST